MQQPPPSTGQLLVATPLIGDPNFERTVVYLLEVNDDGALGLVLNRPSELALADPLPEWRDLAAEPAVIFVGGPVDPERAVGLARLRSVPTPPTPDGGVFAPVVGSVGTLDLTSDPFELVGSLDALRVFSGYAGWGPEQLAGEMEAGAWWVIETDEADLFHPQPSTLWREVLARQPGELARYRLFPDDPDMN